MYRRSASARQSLHAPTAGLAAAALLAGSATVLVVGSAGADTFTSQTAAPTVTTLVSNDLDTMFPASGVTESVGATVGDADTLLDLDNVVLCLYHDSVGSPDAASAGTCAQPDGITAVTITWTQSGNSFVLDDGTATTWALGTDDRYAGGGTDYRSVSNYLSGGTSQAMTFFFRVGTAAREGNWVARVKATDDSAATGSDADSTSNAMAYRGAVSVSRQTQDYGTIDTGATGSAVNFSSGTFVANDDSDIKYGVSTFSRVTAGGGASLSNWNDSGNGGATAVTDAPGSGFFALDCRQSATYDNSSAVRIGGAATTVHSDVLGNGTTESGAQPPNASCRLSNGGTGATNQPSGQYSGTINVTILDSTD